MFTQSILSVSMLALASSVVAKPMPMSRMQRRSNENLARDFSFGDPIDVGSMDSDIFSSSSSMLSAFSSSMSFDDFGGLSSLHGFDNWFGNDNFCGSNNVITKSTTVTESIQCQSESITVVQQQLAIIVEYAKELITTYFCEVETQQIVLSQWLSSIQSFSESIRRVSSSSEVSYDHSIAGLIGDICNSDGSPNLHDFGFSGSSIGSDSVTVLGCNWNDQTSPSSVESAFQSCQSAISSQSSSSISLSPPTWSSISSSCGMYCSLVPPSQYVPPSSSDCTSDCGSSVIVPPPSSDCGSDCGSSVSIPPTSSDCSGSDCGSSVTLPPTSSDCSGSDCGSSVTLPPTSSDCSGSDCGSSVTLPPTSDCSGSDCGSSTSSDCTGSDCSPLSDGSEPTAVASDGSVPTAVVISAPSSDGSDSLSTDPAVDGSTTASADGSQSTDGVVSL